MKLKDLKPIVYFTTEPYGIPPYENTWFPREFDQNAGAYKCVRFDDENISCYMDGDTEVYVDFILPRKQ